MKVYHDRQANAMYIEFQRGNYEISEEIGEDVIVDVAKDGKIIGIEILDVSRRIPRDGLKKVEFATARAR